MTAIISRPADEQWNMKRVQELWAEAKDLHEACATLGSITELLTSAELDKLDAHLENIDSVVNQCAQLVAMRPEKEAEYCHQCYTVTRPHYMELQRWAIKVEGNLT